MRSVGPPLPETIGLPTRLVLCILVRVQNSGILGDFDLNRATCKPFEQCAVFEQSVYNCYDFCGSSLIDFQNGSCYLNSSYQDSTATIDC